MSIKDSTADFGQYAEYIAANYLKQKGFSILAKNFRYKRYEIDLIAQKGELLVFVEVKARKNNLFGYPENFIKRKQISGIRLAAAHYLRKQPYQVQMIRFDIIAILGNFNQITEIMHLEDGFY
ncbi:YraN family protein [Candidatus Cardinium hertigii]|uniref:UPF0102 protein DK880_00484 n=1 Tax=Candidatus Cardinium hertigii TaxID=247481 RepID=A0A2Z3L8T8_9BACT|nr:YraN family protein [Candidatus Cardinium hertigii]AWN81807.1 hypothetical protein DK880_00484 [Candidatus Cardinium hertigii]